MKQSAPHQHVVAPVDKMSTVSFWDVQGLWDRTKNSPIAQGIIGTSQPTKSETSILAESVEGELGEVLLKLLASRGSLDSYALSQELGKDHQHVVGAIKSVQSLGDVRNNYLYYYILLASLCTVYFV